MEKFTVNYIPDKLCKHSIRYAPTTHIGKAPLAVYMPRKIFGKTGQPVSIKITFDWEGETLMK